MKLSFFGQGARPRADHSLVTAQFPCTSSQAARCSYTAAEADQSRSSDLGKHIGTTKSHPSRSDQGADEVTRNVVDPPDVRSFSMLSGSQCQSNLAPSPSALSVFTASTMRCLIELVCLSRQGVMAARASRRLLEPVTPNPRFRIRYQRLTRISHHILSPEQRPITTLAGDY